MEVRSCLLVEIFALTARFSVSQIGTGIQREVAGGSMNDTQNMELNHKSRFGYCNQNRQDRRNPMPAIILCEQEAVLLKRAHQGQKSMQAVSPGNQSAARGAPEGGSGKLFCSVSP
jgi:hypothetical protein